MGTVEDTLKEDYIYFLRELSRIENDLVFLPKGNISEKKIKNKTYYYHQWREGKKVFSKSLGTDHPSELAQAIQERKQLESQKSDISENLKTISKAVDIPQVTAEAVIEALSKAGIDYTLIGSQCLPILKSQLGMKLPSIRTHDIDFLVERPYKGKSADIESLLKPLGFQIGFQPDGSTYFTNGTFRVEFITPEKGKGDETSAPIKALGIRAEPLRFMQMLVDASVKIKRKDFSFNVPNPYTLAFHKILIGVRRKNPDKKKKDLMQAGALLREAVNHGMEEDMVKYFDALPESWKKEIRKNLPEMGLGHLTLDKLNRINKQNE